MLTITQTGEFRRWLGKLRDRDAKARIDIRIGRLARGNPGDTRFLGNGVLELKIDYGPGYRVYYMRKGEQVLLLLAGGDKRRQDRDIAAAIELAKANRSGT
jgi:putative addiction module killer protein